MEKLNEEIKDAYTSYVIITKDEIEKLMSDMKKDLYPEPTEEDIKEMEEAFNLTQKEKQMQEFNEFLEQSKKDYDFEDREEYNYGR